MVGFVVHLVVSVGFWVFFLGWAGLYGVDFAVGFVR